MANELKPCPFCGGKAELITRKQCLADAYSVWCTNKNCRGHTQRLVRVKHKAINDWNRRVTNGE